MLARIANPEGVKTQGKKQHEAGQSQYQQAGLGTGFKIPVQKPRSQEIKDDIDMTVLAVIITANGSILRCITPGYRFI